MYDGPVHISNLTARSFPAGVHREGLQPQLTCRALLHLRALLWGWPAAPGAARLASRRPASSPPRSTFRPTLLCTTQAPRCWRCARQTASRWRRPPRCGASAQRAPRTASWPRCAGLWGAGGAGGAGDSRRAVLPGRPAPLPGPGKLAGPGAGCRAAAAGLRGAACQVRGAGPPPRGRLAPLPGPGELAGRWLAVCWVRGAGSAGGAACVQAQPKEGRTKLSAARPPAAPHARASAHLHSAAAACLRTAARTPPTTAGAPPACATSTALCRATPAPRCCRTSPAPPAAWASIRPPAASLTRPTASPAPSATSTLRLAAGTGRAAASRPRWR